MKERMKIVKVDEEEYARIIREYKYKYNDPKFIRLNRSKVDETEYLLFKNTKYRMGVILGYKDNTALCPFSAPFSMFAFIKNQIQMEDCTDAVEALDEYMKERKVKGIQITLPPIFYDETNISKMVNALLRNRYGIKAVDVNCQFFLDEFNDDYLNKIKTDARRNLKIAYKKSLEFQVCETEEMNEIAYGIIKTNRENKNYPLKMTYEQIKDTAQVIKQDYFLVKNSNNYIASAIVYHVSEKNVQVIYWGDNPIFSELKPMNYLSYKLFEYYKEQGMEVVDIGPSSENGIPNYGLCNFKESIGCSISNRFTMKKEFKEKNGV